MKMTSFQEEFDDSSATRCANGVSAINKLNIHLNDSLEEQKEYINSEENEMSSNVTIMPTLTDGKIKQQNDKIPHDSQDDDEARAFKSQFDEIKCISRMFEYFKNNAYNRFQGRTQRRISESGMNSMNSMNSFHQRSYSHSTHTQQTNRQILKHQRSISSIQGLSFNGNPSTMKFYPTHGAHGLPSTPLTPFPSYGFDNTDDLLSPSRHPWHHFDDSSSINGNDDSLTKFRDLENSGRFGFNNSRFDDWDDSSSGYPSTPLSNGPYTPLTPSSTYSNISPSTPYFAQSHSYLDDDELFEKAKRLEEERLLLQIQQRKLDDAIAAHKLRYHHSDPSLNETEARCKSNNTPPPLITTRGKAISPLQIKPFGIKLTSPPPRFQSSQEPIGTPVKKSGYITPPSMTPTGSSHSTLSASAPTFSLFSNSPALSFNNNNNNYNYNLMNQQKKHHRTMSSDNNNFNHSGKVSPFSGYPLTPSSSPPNTNDGYFGYINPNNNIWVNNNENNYYNTLTSTIFSTPSTGYFRAPLYSTPVDEREEDSLFADEYFSKKNYGNNFKNHPFSISNRHWVD